MSGDDAEIFDVRKQSSWAAIQSFSPFDTLTACRSSLLSGRNVRWPRRMLPPGELRYVDGTDRQTDARPSHYAFRYGRSQHQRIRWTDTTHLTFVSVPCARSSWPSRQLLSARKTTVSYRIVQRYTRSFHGKSDPSNSMSQLIVLMLYMRYTYYRKLVTIGLTKGTECIGGLLILCPGLYYIHDHPSGTVNK